MQEEPAMPHFSARASLMVRSALAGLAMAAALAGGGAAIHAQSQLNEQELIQKLTPTAPVTTRGIRPVMRPGDPPATAATTPAPRPGQSPAPPAEVAKAPSVDLDIKFEFASDRLDQRYIADLDVVGRVMNSAQLRGYSFQIAGHTDAVGTSARNQALSERRAAAVRDYLVRVARVAPERLVTIGYGESRLADPRRPNSGVNRRVEVTTLAPMAALP
ncbi:OmpA family protein [Zavarzinia sp. CC-PAN008]|uniref:OmpA family protein n=1 Tax=Zavarzinia sp. CC-PAN008 TaxID=3243332 RepID=UPI003F7442FB